MKSSLEGIGQLIIIVGIIGIVAPIFGLGLRGFEDVGSSTAGFFMLIIGLAILGLTSLFGKKGGQ